MSNNNYRMQIANLKTIQEERLTFLNLSVKCDVSSAVNTNLT